MKQILAVISVLACGSLAFAGDKEVMPAPVAPLECDWTGFYLGGKIGYGWAGNNNRFAVSVFEGDTKLNGVLDPSTELLEPNGFIGGGEVGYNYQFCRRWVVGAAADFMGSGMQQGSIESVDANGQQAVLTSNQEVDWFGTVRGKIGWLPCKTIMLYGTAGFAYADIQDSAEFKSNAYGDHSVSASGTQTGWAAGGGVEFAINCHWSVKAEYLYVDVGDKTGSETARVGNGGVQPQQNDGLITGRYSFPGTFNTATVGISYKF